MTLAHALHVATTVVYIATNCTIAYFAFPAYKRRQTWGLLLLSYASAVEVFNLVAGWKYQTGALPMEQAYWIYCLLRVTNIMTGLAFATGMILLIREVAPEPAQPPTPTLKSRLQRERDEDAE